MSRSRWMARCSTFLGLLIGLLVLGGVSAIGFYELNRDYWARNRGFRDTFFWVSLGFELFMLVWAFFLGASIASFFNVVAYRVPKRLSILGDSTCPRCLAKIAFYDNIPVLAWIWLGGRCRVCHLPIPVRYPVHEAMGGAIVALIYAATIIGRGFHLPGIDLEAAGYGIAMDFDRIPILLFEIVAFHASVCLFLLAVYLLWRNAGVMPIPVWGLALVLVGLVVTVCPSLFVVHHQGGREQGLGSPTMHGLMLLAGCVAGLGIGGSSVFQGNPTKYVASSTKVRLHIDWILAWALIGLALGWQAVIWIAFFLALAMLFIDQERKWPRLWLWTCSFILLSRSIDTMAERFEPVLSFVAYDLMVIFSVVVFRRYLSLLKDANTSDEQLSHSLR